MEKIIKDNEKIKNINPRSFWHKIKNMMGTKVTLPIKIKLNNVTIENTQDI